MQKQYTEYIVTVLSLSLSLSLILFPVSKTIWPYPVGSSAQTTGKGPQKEASILSFCCSPLKTKLKQEIIYTLF